MLPGETASRSSRASFGDEEGVVAGPSEGGYAPPSAPSNPGEAERPAAIAGATAAGASPVPASMDMYAHQVADEFRWFAFNQPLRGDHFGITKLLLDRYHRERAARHSKDLDDGACGGEAGNWRGGPTHSEWLEYVRDNPDVGLFTIAYMHDGPRPFVKYYVKLLLYIVLGAQLLIPFIFWLYRASFREVMMGEVCPATAPVSSRMISVCVALIYFAKINFLVMEKLARGGKHQALNETDRGGSLQVHVALDRHMDLVFKALVYIINLKIVFIEDNAIEILLNALAMEFILLIPDEMKDLYLRVFEPDVNAYRLANNEYGETPIPRWQFNLIVFFSYYNWAALWLCLVVLFGDLIYLPVCKL